MRNALATSSSLVHFSKKPNNVFVIRKNQPILDSFSNALEEDEEHQDDWRSYIRENYSRQRRKEV